MGGVRGGGQGPQGHTCTWRLFEAATVGKVWRATARERPSHLINPVYVKKISNRIFRHVYGVLNKVYL